MYVFGRSTEGKPQEEGDEGQMLRNSGKKTDDKKSYYFMYDVS